MRAARKRALSLVVQVVVCAIILSLSAHASAVATAYVLDPNNQNVGSVCESLGGSWQPPDNCVLQNNLDVAQSVSVAVDSGAVLSVSSGVTVTNAGEIEDNGTVTTSPGSFMINSGSITGVIGRAVMTLGGSTTNDPGGAILIEKPAHASVHTGSFNLTNTGVFDNFGSVLDYGNFTNGATGTITNSGNFSFASVTINIGKFSAPVGTNAGTFTNQAGATLTLDGATMSNTGTITNQGEIEEGLNVYSLLVNMGTITSGGAIADNSYVRNNGTITNSGTLTTFVGCPVAACGSIANNGVLINVASGTIENQGNLGNNANATLANDGILDNLRVFINNPNATVVNSGTFNSSGSLSNFGIIRNTGAMVNLGTVLNSGDIINNLTGSITNSRTVTNSGSIDNSGSIVDECAGVLFGSGTVTGNAVTEAPCTTTVASPVPQFPAGMLVPVLLSGLILVAIGARKAAIRSPRPSHLASAEMEPESMLGLHTDSRTSRSRAALFG